MSFFCIFAIFKKKRKQIQTTNKAKTGFSMNILIIEDEVDLLESIEEYLQTDGYSVEIVSNFTDAQEKINLYNYSCIVVDIGLPDGDGLNIVTELKKKENESGVIIVSAQNSLDKRLLALDIGADDYLTKPFHLSELSARIKSIIRRRTLKGFNETVFKDIVIKLDTREVSVKDKTLLLTRKEYGLLLYFIMNENRVLSKEAIAEHLWGDDMSLSANSFDFIYSHVKNLRKKLMDNGAQDHIKAIYGIGYKFS